MRIRIVLAIAALATAIAGGVVAYLWPAAPLQNTTQIDPAAYTRLVQPVGLPTPRGN